MKRRNEQRRNRLAWLWTIIRMICIAVIAVSAVLMAQLLLESHSVKEVNRGLQELYRADADELPAPTPPPMEEALTAVYEVNPHTVGWLTAGEHISLPVVQYEDNEFYLERDFYGDKSRAGTLFLDRRCTLWPENSHWMIHGHNMKDGSMFGTLDEYRTLSYLRQYPLITFHTLYGKYDYVPIALFDASMNGDHQEYFRIARFEFADEEEFEQFIAQIREQSVYDIPIEADSGDQLLTLVTCSYSQDNGRLLIVLRRLRDGETASEIAALMQGAERANR